MRTVSLDKLIKKFKAMEEFANLLANDGEKVNLSYKTTFYQGYAQAMQDACEFADVLAEEQEDDD